MDETGDGEVNHKELVHGFRGLGILLPPRIVTCVFEGLDKDCSGAITIEEL